MSAILLIVIGLLLLGAALTFVLAHYRLGYSVELGFVILSMALFAWLIAGQNLPLSVRISNWTELPGLRQWELSTNSTNWLLMFVYLLLTLAGHLVAIAWRLHGRQPITQNRQITALSLLTCVALFTYLNAVTIEGLLTSHGALIFIWILLLYRATDGNEEVQPVWGIGGLFLGLIFLWIAGAVIGDSVDFISGEIKGPSIAATMIMLAGIFQLGVPPFYWWRFSNRASIGEGRDRHLSLLPLYMAPTVAGASLITRLTFPVDLGTSMIVMIAAAGFIALIMGAFLSWQNLRSPERVLAAVACSHVGLIALISLWAGTAALQAAMKAHVLAIGGLLIVSYSIRPRPAWYWLPPLLSLMGAPLTAGFLSRSSFLGGLQSDGLLWASVIVVVLLSPALIGLIMAFRDDGLVVWIRRPVDSRQLLSDVAMFLIFLGLVSNPLTVAADSSLWVWALIVITVLSGFVAANNRSRILILRVRLGHILDWRPSYPRSRRFAPIVLANSRRAIQLAVRLLEGEGGLLWLLVLIAALILIRMQ